jgi:hypothetical protein
MWKNKRKKRPILSSHLYKWSLSLSLFLRIYK